MQSYGTSAMPGVPNIPPTTQEPPRFESHGKKPLPRNAYPDRMRADLREINKDMEGGFVHRTDLWVLAIALRIIAHEKAYSRSYAPQAVFSAEEYETIRQKLFEHLRASENTQKNEVARTAYATRARANAAALAIFSPTVLNPNPYTCEEWREKEENYNIQSFLTNDRNTIFLLSTLSTTYGFLYEKFCPIQ